MTNTDIVLQFIRENAGSGDDAISAGTGVLPRLQVVQICRQLKATGQVRRVVGKDGAVSNYLETYSARVDAPSLPTPADPNEESHQNQANQNIQLSPPSLISYGAFFIIIGAIIGGWSFFIDVGVELDIPSNIGSISIDLPQKVVNANLVGLREMTLIAGGFLFLAGWLAVIAGKIDKLVSGRATTPRD